MEKEMIKVEGMTCGHCVTAVEGSVGELEGVSKVKVNLDDGSVDVEFDKNLLSLAQIKETIDEEGYDVK